MNFGKYKSVWISLLSSNRFDDREGDIRLKEPRLQEGRSPFEADVGRIIFSQPYRRLAGKTQVHPFSSVDYIHNRLTHSNEVGYVSRSLGRTVANFILKTRGDLQDNSVVEKMGWICQAAGLMHDIGNPPYGHAGEDAIRAWARHNEEKILNLCGEKIFNDLVRFDGNAQAFRMASRPGLRETCYFKLTAATLGAMVKYPYATNSEEGMSRMKSAAFSTEETIFDKLRKELGLKKNQRHPLSYLTEAADDICYRINDFEDAVIMGLMDEEEVKSLLLDGMSFDCQNRLRQASLSRVKAKAIGDLIDEFARTFEMNYDSIMEGRKIHDLRSLIDGRWNGVLERIKERYEYIFSERKKVIAEIGSYGQFASVLDKYFELLETICKKKTKRHGAEVSGTDFCKLPFLSQRLITLAWGSKQYYEENIDKPIAWWTHAVLDFIVGMTDEYLHRVAMEIS